MGGGFGEVLRGSFRDIATSDHGSPGRREIITGVCAQGKRYVRGLGRTLQRLYSTIIHSIDVLKLEMLQSDPLCKLAPES